VISKLDFSGSGGITFSEFLIATLDFEKLLTNAKLTQLFSLFDVDHDGVISFKDFKQFLDKTLLAPQAKSIFDEVTRKGEFKLNFSYFRQQVVFAHNNSEDPDKQLLMMQS